MYTGVQYDRFHCIQIFTNIQMIFTVASYMTEYIVSAKHTNFSFVKQVFIPKKAY